MNKLWCFDTFVGTERFHTVLRYLEFPIDAFEIFVSGWDYFPSHMNDVVAKIVKEANSDGHDVLLYKSDFEDWKEVVDILSKSGYTVSHSAKKVVPAYIKFSKDEK